MSTYCIKKVSKLASFLTKIIIISLNPFFAANMTGVSPSYTYNNNYLNVN